MLNLRSNYKKPTPWMTLMSKSEETEMVNKYGLRSLKNMDSMVHIE